MCTKICLMPQTWDLLEKLALIFLYNFHREHALIKLIRKRLSPKINVKNINQVYRGCLKATRYKMISDISFDIFSHKREGPKNQVSNHCTSYHEDQWLETWFVGPSLLCEKISNDISLIILYQYKLSYLILWVVDMNLSDYMDGRCLEI